ncbi:MAG: hypothetical protein IPJ32_19140 [Sphingobacteriaceae bacterium]|nr:hypothetical protein [Sphingobacteriaceae bacterium]
MNTIKKRKNLQMNKYKAVRNNINLNKNNGVQIVFVNENSSAQNTNWAFDFVEQNSEIKNQKEIVAAISGRKPKLTLQWWLN